MHGEAFASNIRELIEVKKINKVYLYQNRLPVECEVSDLSFSSHYIQVKGSIYNLKDIQHYQILADILSLYFNSYQQTTFLY